MTPDLIDRLRALSRHEHSDLTIGDEAADIIERIKSAARTRCDAGGVIVATVKGSYYGQRFALVPVPEEWE